MKVVIIEDEQLAAQKLTRTLTEIVPGVELLDIIPSVEQAVNFFNQPTGAELIFMDIQLEDGICFEIFDRAEVELPIIFTTAFDEYTLKAFKQNSIDYLLKPINKEDLKNAINKYQKNYQPVSLTALQKVMNSFKPTTYKERFLVKVGDQLKSIEIQSVTGFFIKEGYAFMATKDGRNYGLDYTLDKIEGIIDPGDFFRINRNFIVRFGAIENMVVYSSSRLKIKVKGWVDNEDIIVSRERVKSFKAWMDR